MSHPVITAKAKFITLLGALVFSGNGNVVAHKLDTFERPGASVNLAQLRSEPATMVGGVERSQGLQVTLQETFSGGNAEDEMFLLALGFEEAVETARHNNQFPNGLDVHLSQQNIELLPDDSSTAVLTMLFTLNYCQNILTTN